jgi:hypothetical protein
MNIDIRQVVALPTVVRVGFSGQIAALMLEQVSQVVFWQARL